MASGHSLTAMKQSSFFSFSAPKSVFYTSCHFLVAEDQDQLLTTPPFHHRSPFPSFPLPLPLWIHEGWH